MNVRRKSVILGLLSCLAAGLISSGRGQDNNANQDQPTVTAEQLVRAKATFKSKCSRCHGPNGKGDTVLGEMLAPPDFTDDKWWTPEVTDERLMNSIRNGKIEMPAFGRKLAKHEIAALIVYVRCFNKSPHPAATSAERKAPCD
jgi:mono/diheme cytochrome c family protein